MLEELSIEEMSQIDGGGIFGDFWEGFKDGWGYFWEHAGVIVRL